jgi:hypothetical protein
MLTDQPHGAIGVLENLIAAKLGQINQVNIFSSHFFNFHFDIILPSPFKS